MIRAGNGAPGPELKRCWGTPSSLKSLGNTGMQYLAGPDPNCADTDQKLYPPPNLNSFDPAVLNRWRWWEFRLRDQLLNYTFIPETGLDPDHFLPEFTQSDLPLALSSSNHLEGDFIIQNWFFKAVLKVSPPFVCVCNAAMFVKKIFTISLLLLWNHPTFKLSRLNKPEPITSMSDHKVDDI